MPRRFQVEFEPTNTSSGPKKQNVSEAIVSETGIVILQPLKGEVFVIRIIEGRTRLVAPARVIAAKKNRTRLIWLNLLVDDREDLVQLLSARPEEEAQAA